MSKSDLGSEIRSVRYAIGGLRRQIDEIIRAKFPGDLLGPQKWLNLIAGLLDTADLRLTEILTAASEHRISLLAQASQLTSVAYQHVKVCQGVTAAELPYSVVYPLKRLLDELGFQNDFFFRAELEANYEILQIQDQEFRGVRRPSASLVDATGKIIWPLTRITVPSRAFSILPHFAIVGHEIGHALLDRGEIEWGRIVDPSSSPDLIARIESRLDVLNAAHGGRANYNRDFVRQKASEIYRHWFSEFASDAIGFYLMGPALFFALQEFLLITSSSVGISFSHPANYHRLSFLHKGLRENGTNSFAAIFHKATDKELTIDFNNGTLLELPSDRRREAVFSHCYSRLRVPAPHVLAAIMAELNEEMAPSGDAIYSAAKKHITSKHPNLLYSQDRYAEDIACHLDAMLLAVPPIEKSAPGTREAIPTEFASILNVGWIVLLCKLDKLKLGDTSMSDDRRVEILQGLILKAVELSEARRFWQATKLVGSET